MKSRSELSRDPDAIAARFWKKVKKGPGCWTWQGARSSYSRYGMFSLHRHNIHAHRAAWIITHGPIASQRTFVLHRCFNGHLGCVRPDHLYLGDYKQNGADMIISGRTTAVLKPEQVRKVRKLLGIKSTSELAKQFGVRYGVIYDIRRGETHRGLQ